MKKKVYIIVNEHFDIMWRRCFDRDFIDKDRNFVSYADLEGFYIMDNIDLCEKYPMYKFTVESVAVLRKFLEHHPEYEERVKELFEEERLFVTMSGDNIVDSNMVQGESIVRNYLYGLEYLKDNFNHVPYGLDRNDAFGNSGQIPQIARGFNNKWVYHLVYTICDKEYWRGIDGSTLYYYEPKIIGGTGGYYKYAPCPVCRGFKKKHCEACNDRRIDVPAMEKIRTKIKFDEDYVNNNPIPGYIRVGGEEILPIDNIMEWVEENKDKYDIEFTTFDKYKEYIEDKLERVDEVGEDELHSSAEVNPNNTGTYVTRIKTKQRVRENENLIFTAEALGTILGVNGKKYNTEIITKLWEKLHFTMFHDAITATHIDAAYDELMEFHNELESALGYIINNAKRQLSVKNENKITVLNTLGVETVCTASVIIENGNNAVICDENGKKVSVISREETKAGTKITFIAGRIKAFDKKCFNITYGEIEKVDVTDYGYVSGFSTDAVVTNESKIVMAEDSGREAVIENEFLKVFADEKGIVSVYDKKLDKEIATKGQYYIGEFILEHDEGSPWATLSEDMRREGLSKVTRLSGVVNGDNYQELVFKAMFDGAYSLTGFNAECRVRLQKGDNKLLFNTDVEWDVQNYRLRIAIPANINGRHIYEIPYGYIQRHPYKNNIVSKDNSSNWASAAGDWPAINWAGIEGDDYSVVLMNKGTPSYQINTDEEGKENIYLTVLRSPSVGTYLHDPAAYSMVDYDGMRDAGEHHFEYALTAYKDGFDKNDAVSDALAYNTEAVSILGDVIDYKMPEIISDDVRISSVKRSQKGDMLIYRLVEFHGKDSEFTLKVPEELNVKEVYEMNLNEEILETIQLSGNEATIKAGKFKIKTIAFKF